MNNRTNGAKPLRTPGNSLPGISTLILAAILAMPPVVSAQESAENAAEQPDAQTSNDEVAKNDRPREDYYRAEFVIIERKAAPSGINERMASRIPEPPNPEVEEILRAVDGSGAAETTLELVPREELHLNTAASRLENSGRFRVLLAAGWYQSFPPDFDGEPLRVAIGDWLEDAGHREVEGHITIDRQRYLHVGVHLNHWQPGPPIEQPLDLFGGGAVVDQASDSGNDEQGGAIDEEGVAVDKVSETIDEQGQAFISGVNWPRAELLTWIRETRRMRSEEVHFLDSPTIGVLVFFKKIEE